jgi:hypothetical protein
MNGFLLFIVISISQAQKFECDNSFEQREILNNGDFLSSFMMF